jgi:hypothetical protein
MNNPILRVVLRPLVDRVWIIRENGRREYIWNDSNHARLAKVLDGKELIASMAGLETIIREECLQ